MNGRIKYAKLVMCVSLTAICLSGCQAPRARSGSRWNDNYSSVIETTPVVFHYNHGVLAGSYPDDAETVEVRFEDVCGQLGHVCLCGAGGFRIAREAAAALRHRNAPPERCEFVLISGRDHTVSDVIAFVLGCSRRTDPEKSRYLIDDSVKPPRREYRYYIAYPPAQKAVEVVYRKHLLIGNDEMDKLWTIETAYDHDPDSSSLADIEQYRKAMLQMVRDVIFDRTPDLITVKPIDYADFQERLQRLRD